MNISSLFLGMVCKWFQIYTSVKLYSIYNQKKKTLTNIRYISLLFLNFVKFLQFLRVL